MRCTRIWCNLDSAAANTASQLYRKRGVLLTPLRPVLWFRVAAGWSRYQGSRSASLSFRSRSGSTDTSRFRSFDAAQTALSKKLMLILDGRVWYSYDAVTQVFALLCFRYPKRGENFLGTINLKT